MIYMASLVVVLVTAFWRVNPFTNSLDTQLEPRQLPPGCSPSIPTCAIIVRTVIHRGSS